MKSKILSFVIVLTSFSACIIANSSVIEIEKKDLIGTWIVKDLAMDNAKLNVTSPISTTLSANGFGKNFNTTLTFSEKPNIATINGNFTFELTYPGPSGIQQTKDLILNNIFFNDNFGFRSSTWVLTDNILQLNEGGETLQITIVDFVNNVLSIDVNVEKAITLDGITSTVVGTTSVQLEKVQQ